MKKPLVIALLAALALGAFAPQAAAARDRRRPTMKITTDDGAMYYLSMQNPALEHAVRGTATDRRAGIRAVVVRFKPCQSLDGRCEFDELRDEANDQVVLGGKKMSCTNKRRSCAWEAAVPTAPGPYKVSAYAVDRAGNRSKTRSIRITVV